MFGVGCVVGGDAVDDAVGEGTAQRIGVGGLPQWRVDPVAAVVGGQPTVVKHQVMRRYLGCDRNALCLSPSDDLNGARRGGVADVHARSCVAGQQRVAGDDGFLSGAGPAGQTEPRGVGSLVGHGADREPRLFGVLRDQDTKAGGVLERAPHDQRIVHAHAVVGEQPHLAGAGGHHAHLGELLSGKAHGDGADRMHVDEADLLATVPDVVGDDGAVGDGIGVGHREHRGVAAQRRRRRTGFDVLGIFAAGLTQVGV